ncbi:hypothetical protein A3K73_01850 [Candidatus Pacearchaeota archaeon RBG_13_36_9]|nr:MAG: hypothetical protein A3K73_01850 [Candidatus Pacearchaeota archaeon RBG_13_36_9]
MKSGTKKFFIGGAILFVSYNLFNLFNLIFNFMAARKLGPADYGIFAAIMSLILIFTFPMESIQTVICRMTIKFKVGKKDYEIKRLMINSLKRSLIFSAIGYICVLLVSSVLGQIIHIDQNLLILAGLYLFGTFLIPVTRGTLQGTKRFTSLGLTYIVEGAINLGLGILLIYLGFGVSGAVIGAVLSIIIAFFVSFIFLKEILYLKTKEIKDDKKISYPLASLIAVTCIVVLMAMDILAAKIFFPPKEAGYYGTISYLGKIIFLGTWGISRAMFPLASENYDKKKDYMPLLEKTFVIIFFISFAVCTIYFLFPRLIIGTLYGEQYLIVSSLLAYPAISMMMLSLTNIFVLFNISTNHPKRNYIVAFFVPLEILALSIFNSSLQEFSITLVVSNMLLFFAMVFVSLRKSL